MTIPAADTGALNLALRGLLAQDEKAITELVDRLEGVQTAIAQSEALLKQRKNEQLVLEALIARKRQELDEQKQLLCPVTRLSDEILASILNFTQPDDVVPEPIGSPPRTTFYLASVCRRWRGVATGSRCGMLWCRVFFNFDAPAVALTHLIDVHLTRSGHMPLRVRVVAFIPKPTHNAPFHAILRASARWRTFSFSFLRCGSGNDHLLFDFQRPTPLLEEFELRNYYDNPTRDACSTPFDRPVIFLPHAPRLRVLKIEPCLLQGIQDIPRPSLRELHLHGCDEVVSVRLLHVLASTPSLVTLKANASIPPLSPVTDAASHIELPRLESLDCDCNLVLAYVDILSLPALVHLEVRAYRSVSGTERIFERYATVRELSITASHLEPPAAGQLPPILRPLASIERLRVHRFQLSADDFAPLSTLAPMLRDMRLYQPVFATQDAAASVVDFVRCRTSPDRPGGGARLEVFELTSGPPWLRELTQRICTDARGEP